MAQGSQSRTNLSVGRFQSRSLLSRYAEELVGAAPDILLAFGTATLIPLHKATTTIPIVFASVSDPVGQGFVASVSRPGGNLRIFQLRS
jgi:putative ABC transport system substrate-binding protein